MTGGRGELGDWLKGAEIRETPLLDEDADPAVVTEVTLAGNR